MDKFYQDFINGNFTIPDGIYDLDGIEFWYDGGNYENCDSKNKHIVKKLKEWAKKYPDFAVANAYGVSGIFFLSNKPKRIEYKNVFNAGEDNCSLFYGFNYGTCSILTNLPKNILIVAEDD